MDPRFPDRAAFREALVAAARELDAAVQDGPGEAWTVAGGTPACANPNAAPWKAVASLAADAWGLSPRPVGLPWNRRRAAEIATFRTRQLEGLLRAPHPAEPHERFPFTAGSTLADRAEAFSWIVAGGALAMALTLVAVTLAGVPLLERELARLSSRADVMTRIGADALPRQAELDGLGWLGRLAAAFMIATPIAFFLGGLHAGVNALGERIVSVARFAPWCLVFVGASSLLAFLPRMVPPLAILGGLLVPGAAFLGTSLLWGRRRDVTRAGPRENSGFRPAVLIAAAFVLVVLVALVPMPTSTKSRVHETARFRDRFLLGSAAGRALAHFYYDYTLYAAEPVKPPYSAEPEVTDRQVRTALVVGKLGADADALRTMDFSVERIEDADAALPLIAKGQHDLYVIGHSLIRPFEVLSRAGLLGRTIRQGTTIVPGFESVASVPAPATAEEWQKAAGSVLRHGGMESMLLELTWLGWTSVFYGGPIFVLLLAVAPLSAGLAWLARRRSPQGARRIVGALFAVSVGGLVVAFLSQGSALARLAELKRLPADDQKALDILAAGLKDADAGIRYEAAYQAFMALKRPTFPKGGLTEELKAGSRDATARVRLWCAAALGLTRDEKVRPDILRALNDEDMLVRYRAAEGLEHLDGDRQPTPPESIAALRRMVQVRSWYEGMYALAALRKLDPRRY